MSMPETTEPQLTDHQVCEIEKRFASELEIGIVSRGRLLDDGNALIRDWRALRAAQADHSDEIRILSQAVREAEANRDGAVKLVETLRQQLQVKSELLDKAMTQALELDTQNAALREQLARQREDDAHTAFETVMAVENSEYEYSALQKAAQVAAAIRAGKVKP